MKNFLLIFLLSPAIAFGQLRTSNTVPAATQTALDLKLTAASNLSDVGSASTARNNILPSKTGNALKVFRVNAGETDYELVTLAGGGDMLSTNNLSDLANAGTARTNLGGTTIGKNLFTLTDPSAITWPRFNADNTVTPRTSAELLGDIGAAPLTSPTLVTPILGVATATSINKVTITAPATASVLTINDGVTLTVTANTTLSGTPLSNPMTTLGDVIYGGASGVATRLAGDGTNNRKFLMSQSVAGVATAPSWQSLTSGDVGLGNVENTALSTWAGTSNVTTLGTIGTGVWNGTIIGKAYGGTGEDNSTGGTANTFWARPNGATGAASYRAIVAADLPNTSVSAASYVNGNFTVDAAGRLTAASNGYSAISPSQITGDQDNWNPSGLDDATTIRVSGDATIRAITSITAPTQIYKPQIKTIYNIGTSPVYFPSEHPDGTAANRFAFTEDYVLFPGKGVRIEYDITSSRWRLATGDISPSNYTVYYDHAAGTVTSGDIGQMTFLTIGTGTNTATAATTTLPASMLYSTAASATAGFMGYFSKSVLTYSAFATGHNFAEATVSIPTLSTGTETFFAYLQLTATPNSTTAEVNNSCGIRYNEAVNGGRWQLYTQDNAGAESTADLGVTVATATLYKLRIEIDKAKTEVRAYINYAYAGRVTGNMPNSVVMGSRTLLVKTVGTTARTMAVHRQRAGAIH